MYRRPAYALTAALLLTACADDQAGFGAAEDTEDALVSAPVDAIRPPAPAADADLIGSGLRNQFDTTVKPILQQFCASCHSGANGPGFTPSGADWYDAVVAWPNLVNFSDPHMSSLVTRGLHEGPAFTPFQLTSVTAWLEAEAAHRTGWGAPPPDMGIPDAGPLPDVADPLAEARRAARLAYDTGVQPILSAVCTACHVAGGAGPGFLTPNPDAYTTLLNWPGLIDLERPNRSRLLTRGNHAGPAFTEEQRDIVLNWIGLEVTAHGRTVMRDPETPSFPPVFGGNAIDLTPLGLPGSTLTFSAELLAAGLYVSSMMVNAGVTGAHLVHPLFVVWKAGTPTPDAVDSFAGLDLTVAPGMSASLGRGTLVLVDFAAGDQLSVVFEVAEPSVVMDPDAGVGGSDAGLGGGCRAVASFTQYAQPQFAQYCTNCHAGGNAAALANLDMSRMGDLTAEGQAAACAQAHGRINQANPIDSGLFTVTEPGSAAGHPFQFNGDRNQYDAFRSQLLLWIVQE